MFVLTVVMIAIEATICVVKPEARGFALIVLVAGLAGRLGTIVSNRAVPLTMRAAKVTTSPWRSAAIAAEVAVTVLLGHSPAGVRAVVPGRLRGRLRQLPDAGLSRGADRRRGRPADRGAEAPADDAAGDLQAEGADHGPDEGNPRLIDFAIKECKTRQAELAILFVRHLAVTPMGPTAFPKLDEDEQALALFDQLRDPAREAGVPLRLLYGVARDIPDAILDMAVTHGADLLMLGTTRRGTLWKAMKGDVIQAVAEQLPESIDLLIHAGAADRDEESRVPPAAANV